MAQARGIYRSFVLVHKEYKLRHTVGIFFPLRRMRTLFKFEKQTLEDFLRSPQDPTHTLKLWFKHFVTFWKLISPSLCAPWHIGQNPRSLTSPSVPCRICPGCPQPSFSMSLGCCKITSSETLSHGHQTRAGLLVTTAHHTLYCPAQGCHSLKPSNSVIIIQSCLLDSKKAGARTACPVL